MVAVRTNNTTKVVSQNQPIAKIANIASWLSW